LRNSRHCGAGRPLQEGNAAHVAIPCSRNATVTTSSSNTRCLGAPADRASEFVEGLLPRATSLL
jgi:hypothetical protein